MELFSKSLALIINFHLIVQFFFVLEFYKYYIFCNLMRITWCDEILQFAYNLRIILVNNKVRKFVLTNLLITCTTGSTWWLYLLLNLGPFTSEKLKDRVEIESIFTTILYFKFMIFNLPSKISFKKSAFGQYIIFMFNFKISWHLAFIR